MRLCYHQWLVLMICYYRIYDWCLIYTSLYWQFLWYMKSWAICWLYVAKVGLDVVYMLPISLLFRLFLAQLMSLDCSLFWMGCWWCVFCTFFNESFDHVIWMLFIFIKNWANTRYCQCLNKRNTFSRDGGYVDFCTRIIMVVTLFFRKYYLKIITMVCIS